MYYELIMTFNQNYELETNNLIPIIHTTVFAIIHRLTFRLNSKFLQML